MARSILSQLALLISSSVETLENACQENQLPIPNLNAPGFLPQSEAFRSIPVAAEAAIVAAAACMQLAASLLPPTDTMYRLIAGTHHSAAVRVCLEANVTEILREAGPRGLHVDDIAAKCHLDPLKLERILRYLANNHVYRELKPQVFTNNRISSTLDTGKPSKDIFSDPESKYDFTGFQALASHHLDLNHKCSTVVWDTLKDLIPGQSDELTDTVFARGLGTNMPIYQFLEHPDNRFRLRRFGFAMQGLAAIQPKDTIFKAFDWEALPKGSVVVDIGGGIGSATMPLARKYDHLHIIIQDRPKVVDEGKMVWLSKLPGALNTGRVKIQAHDFFEPQPIKDASIFLIKQVLHNWPISYMSKILRHLREAANKDTILIIIDNVLSYACRDSADSEFDSESPVFKAPEPLLPNYGGVKNAAYTMDITMMFYNAQEHTLLGLKDLLASTGWRLLRIRAIDPQKYLLKSVEAVPM